MLQLTSWIGIYGLSFLTILTAVSFSTYSKKLIFFLTGIMASLWCLGKYRLHHAPFLEHQGFNIRLVQASIPQNLKWLSEEQEKNILLYMALSGLEEKDL